MLPSGLLRHSRSDGSTEAAPVQCLEPHTDANTGFLSLTYTMSAIFAFKIKAHRALCRPRHTRPPRGDGLQLHKGAYVIA